MAIIQARRAGLIVDNISISCVFLCRAVGLNVEGLQHLPQPTDWSAPTTLQQCATIIERLRRTSRLHVGAPDDVAARLRPRRGQLALSRFTDHHVDCNAGGQLSDNRAATFVPTL